MRVLLSAQIRRREFGKSIPAEDLAYSDESGHLFRFVSDTDPTISDSGRSEATLGGEQ